MHEFTHRLQDSAKLAAGVEVAKTFLGKAAHFQQGNGQRIPHRHLQQRRGGGCQIMRAGLLSRRQDNGILRPSGQSTLGFASYRNNGNGKARSIGDNIGQFTCFTGPGEKHHHIIILDHT